MNMFLYVALLIVILYAGYSFILALPCGKEEPATVDEIEWFYDKRQRKGEKDEQKTDT